MLPAGLANMPMYAAVGDNFDIMICQQQINQHAIVMLGIPDIEMSKQIDRPLPRRQASQDSIARQARLNHNPDFTSVTLFTVSNYLFYVL